MANEQQANSECQEVISDTIQFHDSDYIIPIENPERTFKNPALPLDSPVFSTASVMENNCSPPGSPVFSMHSESMKGKNQANDCQSNPDEHKSSFTCSNAY